jgi:hypothetical protein
MIDIRLRRIGQEKINVFEKNFDKVYDYYKQKAQSEGYFGEIKFIKERGKIIIYVVIELPEIEEQDDESRDGLL